MNPTKQKPGRPFGRNAYGESTVTVRLPKSKAALVTDCLKQGVFLRDNIDALDKNLISPVAAQDGGVLLPLYLTKVAAGFPSPAEDHVKKRLNIHEYLVSQEAATFMVTIVGDSMRDAGLLSGDIAIVDRSKTPVIGNIIMAVLYGEFTIKSLGATEQGNALLIPANANYKPIEIKEDMDFEIWGVVTGSIRKYL